MRPFIRPLRKDFAEMLAVPVFINLIALIVPVFTLQVYDRVIFSAGVSVIIVFDHVIRQARSRIMQRVALRLDVEVGRTLFDKITSLPLQHLENRTSDYWQSLFRGVDLVRNTLSGPPAILWADLPFTIIFFGLIFMIAQPLAPVLIVIWLLFVIIAWRSSAVMSSANSEERDSRQTRDTLVGEMINGRTTIKALGLETTTRPV